MSIASVITALQAKHVGLSGVKTAPTAVPSSLNTAQLPIVIVLPGPAAWSNQAIGLTRNDRTYNVRVYVAPIAQGQGIDQGYQATIALMQTLGAAYVDWPNWHGSNFEQMTAIADDGHQVLSYAGIDYHGATFRLNITEKPL